MSSQYNLALTAAILLSFFAIPVVAEEPGPSDPPPGAENASAAPGVPNERALRATRVFRNPDTGEIEFAPGASMPVPGLSVREQNMLNRSDEGLKARVLENGAVAVNLQGRFQSMATAATDHDTGELNTRCSIDGGAHADETHATEQAE
jgi:hypothetical protein